MLQASASDAGAGGGGQGRSRLPAFRGSNRVKARAKPDEFVHEIHESGVHQGKNSREN
jgi:hypothetical protein